ncbi:hypothetical protein QBC34DRAFT_443427 [Podospora aff. communis PSN243]|uniref:SMP-30/Gluconolactonase/LRE-like region domain-containing protein n=1 Tax=Podospora aff. communis PSN243 TaxID=3040156 RepID=A0AAV9G500_9PEZI|nr:hypothetical protein QBC34DRAFT_443427 [Podospora aff. communis PSN243]
MRPHAPILILANTATALINPPTQILPHRIIYEFPKPSWIENIAIRPSSALLLILLSSPTLQTIPNPTSPQPVALPVYTFPNATGQTGIAPLTPNCDAYIVLAGNPSLTGSFSAYTITFPPNSHPPNTTSPPTITLIAPLPAVALPNGITPTPHGRAALIADSLLGLIWRLDLVSGEYHTALQTPETAAPPGSPPKTIAVNGVKIHKGYLYFSNSVTVSIYRIPINTEGYPLPNARVETVAKLDAKFLDDFVVGEGGVVYVATNLGNTVVAVDVESGSSVVVLEVYGPTAVALGRGERDREVLYVVTDGGLMGSREELPEGGRVVAVEVGGVEF